MNEKITHKPFDLNFLNKSFKLEFFIFISSWYEQIFLIFALFLEKIFILHMRDHEWNIKKINKISFTRLQSMIISKLNWWTKNSNVSWENFNSALMCIAYVSVIWKDFVYFEDIFFSHIIYVEHKREKEQ